MAMYTDMINFCKILDTVIRYMAIAGLMIFTPIAVIFSLTAISAPNLDKLSGLLVLFQCFIGVLLIGFIIYWAKFPTVISKYSPIPSSVSAVISRIVVYPVGFISLFLLVRQVWLVTIPELLTLFS